MAEEKPIFRIDELIEALLKGSPSDPVYLQVGSKKYGIDKIETGVIRVKSGKKTQDAETVVQTLRRFATGAPKEEETGVAWRIVGVGGGTAIRSVKYEGGKIIVRTLANEGKGRAAESMSPTGDWPTFSELIFKYPWEEYEGLSGNELGEAIFYADGFPFCFVVGDIHSGGTISDGLYLGDAPEDSEPVWGPVGCGSVAADDTDDEALEYLMSGSVQLLPLGRRGWLGGRSEPRVSASRADILRWRDWARKTYKEYEDSLSMNAEDSPEPTFDDGITGQDGPSAEPTNADFSAEFRAEGKCVCGVNCVCDCGCAETGVCNCGESCPCDCGCGVKNAEDNSPTYTPESYDPLTKSPTDYDPKAKTFAAASKSKSKSKRRKKSDKRRAATPAKRAWNAKVSTKISTIMADYEKTGKIGNSRPKNKASAMKQAIAVAYSICAREYKNAGKRLPSGIRAAEGEQSRPFR